MNSYNENLQSTVVATLAIQELEQQTMEATLDASMLTLYYAGGARITAAEKLDGAQAAYTFQQSVKEQAVINNNISNSMLVSATQEKATTAQSVTNTSVAAANIQVAANAIMKLSGDVGSAFNMISAAEFGSDIYTQGAEADRLMRETASIAEQVSLTAMDASRLIAQAPAANVADEAKVTSDAVTNIFKVASAGFDAISAAVTADNATLAAASASEKQSEGIVEMNNVEYYAANKAYALNNQELNLNLQVPLKTISNTSYTVQFNYYTAPFEKTVNANKTSDEVVTAKTGYPVSEYYIMLVKSSKKSTFVMSTAESIIASDDETRYVTVPNAPIMPGQTYASKTISITDIVDSDGDPMMLGGNYVVFVLAMFTTDYKKKINNFDDYLSAPSPVFALTNALASPLPPDIGVDVNALTLSFSLDENVDYIVDYRCMFLPVSSRLVKGLLSEQGLRNIENEVERMEEIADMYDPQIEALETEIASLQADLAADQGKKDTQKIEAEIRQKQKDLDQVVAEKDAALNTIDPSADPEPPGFFFNLLIAEQVSPANYSKASITFAPVDGKNKNKDKGKHKVTGTLMIDDTITDNFGNPLIDGQQYIPAILSIVNADKEDPKQFSNSLSAYEATASFVYSAAGEEGAESTDTQTKKA